MRRPKSAYKRLEQIKTVHDRLRQEIASSGLDLNALPKEKARKLLEGGVWWSWVYEFSMVQHLALFFCALGLREQLIAAAKEGSEALVQFFLSHEPSDSDIEALVSGENAEIRARLIAALWIALFMQFECVRKQGCYLSELVQRGSSGEGEAFLRALRIDRTIVTCPSFAERLSRAVLEGDQAFLSSVGNNIRRKWKKVSPKSTEKHGDLRMMLLASEEMGILKNVSMTEADKLFIQELGVYEEGDDPARSLQRFITRWKNSRKTSKSDLMSS